MLFISLHNDGTGTETTGNYDVVVSVNNRIIWEGRVENHDREKGWRELLRDLIAQSGE